MNVLPRRCIGVRLLLMAMLLGGGGCREGCGGGEAEKSVSVSLCPRASEIHKVDIHAHLELDATQRALAIMDRRGFERIVNASGGYGRKADASAKIASDTGGRILFYCNIDFRQWGDERFAEEAVEELERCRQLGGVGLKLFKSLGLKLRDDEGKLVAVDDPALDPVFEKAGELGMIVLIHSGDPKAFFEPADEDNERWAELEAHPKWSFHGEGYPSWDEVYAQFERRVARHPDTTFLGAHFGNNPEDPERVFEMMRKYPNLRIDTAARVPEIGRFDPVRMNELYGEFSDRIHFGTDIGIGVETLMLGSGPPYRPGPKAIDRFFSATWRYFETADRQFEHPTPIQGDWKIDGIGLSCELLERVYHENTEKLLGFAPLGSGGGGS